MIDDDIISMVDKLFRPEKNSVAHYNYITDNKSDKIDELKTDNPYFSDVWNGEKDFEHRKDDRNFMKEQIVILEEYNRENNKFSGRAIIVKINYLMYSNELNKIREGYCIFKFDVIFRINNFKTVFNE